MRRRWGCLSSLCRPRRGGRAAAAPLPQPDPPRLESKEVEEHGASDKVVMENILSNNDFSEGLHLWHPNGCHGFVAVEGSGYHHGIRPHSGSNYAVLTRRTHNWQGLEQDITEKVTVGTEYIVAAHVRVHGELNEPVGIQATLKLEGDGSSTNYQSVARISASKDCWEKLEGSFELKTLPRRLVFYIEGPPPGVDLLIDSVTISYKKTERAASKLVSGTENIISNYDFSEGLHLWNPICCHAYVASQWSGFLDGIRGSSGENYAVVSKRTESWQGLEQDITDKVSAGTAYAVSAYVRVDGNIHTKVEVKATLRLHNTDDSTHYSPVGSLLASKEKWEKMEGSFCLTNMPKRVVFYLEGPPAGVDLIIDSVNITCSGYQQLKEVKVPSGVDTIVKNPHFDEGLNNWSGRGCNICRHELTAYGNVKPLNGSYFASATGRVHNWNGIQQDITGRVQRKVLYEISSAVRIFGSANDTEVRVTLWVQEYGRERYVSLAKNPASDKQWTHLKGKFLLHAPFSKAVIFVEGPPAGIDILVDGLVLSPARKLHAAPRPRIENVSYGANVIHNSAFSHGLSGWSPMGSCRLSIHTESPHMLSAILKDPSAKQHIRGSYILATNRTDVWMGPSQLITDKLRLHTTYRVSAWVRAGSGGHGRYHVNVCLAVDHQWVNGGQVEADGDQWYELKGAFKLEKKPSKVTAYVQGPPPGVDLRVMGFQIYAVDRKARFEYLKEKTDKVRKRDVILKFQGSDAANLFGSSIKIQQTENSFPFGSCIGRSNIENEDLADFFVKNFNWAVFENELKWYWTEAEQGRLNYKDSDELLEFCRKHNIQVRGHCLFWEVEDSVQPWIRSLHGHHLMAAIQNRLQSLLSRYKGQFKHHDVNNEMLHGSFYQDRLGNDIRAHMFREAHKLDPSAVLFVNDYNVEDRCDSKSTPEKLIEQIVDLQERGAPVGGIGLQGHITHPVGDIICDSLDKLSILGLPIWITELDVTAENEHIRADDLEVYLREAFAHPSVEGIILWGFWELFMFREHAHLVDVDGTINEAGKRYIALKQEWLTSITGNVDHHGELKFRGYHGSYTVEVATPSGKVTRSFVVDKDNAVQVVTLNI
ncbi:endo-1,4-beta-xylanase 1-like isoform X2 [Oryza glaberrima]|uniref:GH10 domain-containing protein n=2 Tax=Oryza TaxID=4527 RepID=A0A0D3GQK4_9ORYZ|nr:endo-1,4-beta-xylanase 1-like isoform X2 [Oryza glaberrima]XP_052162415.1 endo-1,4-beta-xylanase 1-like isoform X2 [Oryza glaberrima]XP_052162416.1 endo-1,4-beta-xylanase 1-like isoform X2 [Oryza glaberrima]